MSVSLIVGSTNHLTKLSWESIARQQGISGMTVMRAISGYGKHGIFRTMNELDPSTESSVLPLVITVIDSESAITEFFRTYALTKNIIYAL